MPSLGSLSVTEAVYAALKERVEWYAYPQMTTLAVRLTPDTPGVVACPNFDTTRGVERVQEDPTCLGVGWIMPANGNVPAQPGYLLPVPFDCVIVPGEVAARLTQFGIQQFPDETVAFWPPRQSVVQPKKYDVFIVTIAGETQSQRYVIGDVESPGVLGSQTLFWRAALEPREAGDIVYSIPPADTTGVTPGQWD